MGDRDRGRAAGGGYVLVCGWCVCGGERAWAGGICGWANVVARGTLDAHLSRIERWWTRAVFVILKKRGLCCWRLAASNLRACAY